MTDVSILSADNVTAATAHVALTHALVVERVGPPSDVEHVSPDLGEQISRVQVAGEWPAPTPAGGGEVAVVRDGDRQIVTRTVAGNDLRLHRERIKQLLGSVNVLALHWKFYQPAARYGVFARAFWLQQELGLSAEEALLESLSQLYGIDEVQLGKDRPKLLSRIRNKLCAAKWGIDLTKDAPAERYPLSGVGARDTRPLYRDLDDLIIAECRKVAPELRLLAEVLNESDAPLIVVFAGDEELAFTPGLGIDWLKVAQSVVSPRPGVSYVAEQLVHLRQANDAETIDTLEGCNSKAGALIWGAIVASLGGKSRTSAAAKARTLSRPIAVAGAVALPVIAALLAIFGGFTANMATLGVLALFALEVLFLIVAWPKPAKKPVVIPPPLPTAPATPAEPAARPAVEIPAAIANRAAHVCLNGTHA